MGTDGLDGLYYRKDLEISEHVCACLGTLSFLRCEGLSRTSPTLANGVWVPGLRAGRELISSELFKRVSSFWRQLPEALTQDLANQTPASST